MVGTYRYAQIKLPTKSEMKVEMINLLQLNLPSRSFPKRKKVIKLLGTAAVKLGM